MPTKMLPRPTSPVSLADVLRLVRRQFADIDPVRIRLEPRPGTATEADLIDANERKDGPLCELVDGTLVEKVMGFEEATIGGEIYSAIREFIRPRRLGVALPADGMMRLAPGLIRLPDVTYNSAAKFRAWRTSKPTVADFGPDLAVEVLSKSNRRGEIERKRNEYFAAGTTLVWEVNPRRQTVSIYTSPAAGRRLGIDDTLTGDPVLPGFSLPLAELFADPLGD